MPAPSRWTRRLRSTGLVGALTAGVLVVGAVASPGLGVPDRGPAPVTTTGASRATDPTTGPTTGPAGARTPERRPNIVLITSDDQTDTEMRWMPRTRRLLTSYGVSFSDGINPHPLCCPARAEILTGEYAHNNGVRHNTGPHGGYPAFAAPPREAPVTGNPAGNLEGNLASWLHDAGYRTGFVGKMLNGYTARSPQMDGWDHWDPTVRGTYAYYGTRFWNDGRPRDYPRAYVADVVRDTSVRLIRRWAPQDRPFFLWASHVGPHQSIVGGRVGPPVPARRHEGLFRDVALPAATKASYNEPDVSDKPAAVRAERPKARPYLTRVFRDRLRSLQAVDESNAAMIRALAASGELARTLVVYVSDNGYLLGEHRLTGKNFVYDENLQIPFVMRGPGVPRGVTRRATATLVDLAPTFLDHAGVLEAVRSTGRTDGLSLRAALRGETMPNETTLIQAGTDEPAALTLLGWWWRGVRTPRFTWARWWDGTEELYDRARDPHEEVNLVRPDGTLRNPRYAVLREELESRYTRLAECDGVAQCEQQRFGALPASVRVPGATVRPSRPGTPQPRGE